MLPKINIYAQMITQKQKRDLLGIYQDYLYFERGLEMILHIRSIHGLTGMFLQQVGWSKDMVTLPWHMVITDKKELDAYIRFVNGDTKEAKQYTYVSLYHTNKEQDVSHPKISGYPETYDFTTIDLDLPCPVERYALAFPQEQKIKDAKMIIDGKFEITYCDDYKGDMTIEEALNDTKIQQQFRVLLSIMEIYNQNLDKLEENPNLESKLTNIMSRIIASETISSYENKLLDLLGSCADKTQEVLRTIYPDKSSKELWMVAEKDGFIPSAESMTHFLNIRHLIRHQWDSLDNLSKYSSDGNSRNEKMRNEYLQSYHWIFQNTLNQRIKLYQQFSQHFQPLIQMLHPEFLARNKSESNSKFIQRIKQWQKDNPNNTPLINGNYLLYEDKHIALINNIKKVAPRAIVLDNLREEDLEKHAVREKSYFKRAVYLKTYSQIESCFALYCLATGLGKGSHIHSPKKHQ